MAKISMLERCLALQLEQKGINTFVQQYAFKPEGFRNPFKFDFAWPQENIMLVVEVEGGTWVNGRHVRPQGFQRDCEKYNEALLAGWHVLRVTSSHVNKLDAVQWIERFLINCGELSES